MKKIYSNFELTGAKGDNYSRTQILYATVLETKIEGIWRWKKPQPRQ